MKFLLPTLICIAAFAQTTVQQPVSPVKVTRIATPAKALKFEVVVPARISEVWKALSTSEGLNGWLWQDCTVDLRPGGEWIAHYPGGKTGGGTIIAFETGRRLELRALAPEQFPEVRRTGTTATFDLVPAGSHTRVTLTQTGWKQGKEWDDAYEYLANGNAQLLYHLYLRFARGPLKWQ